MSKERSLEKIFLEKKGKGFNEKLIADGISRGFFPNYKQEKKKKIKEGKDGKGEKEFGKEGDSWEEKLSNDILCK